jgi:ABC-2 type transport system permease protein
VDARWVLARQSFRDARVRTVSFAAVFALYAYVQAVAYRHAYPTRADKLGFARSFSSNKAIRLFYGQPHDLLSVSGYVSWRVGGTLAIAAAVFGLLAAVRALRAEEEAGRTELALACSIGRGSVYGAALAAIAASVLLLWLAEFAGFLAGGLPAGGSAYLALATVAVIPPCAGVGALASQLAPSRRGALELGGAVVGLLFLARVVADTSVSAEWLRWATPLGWAEEMRPFTGSRPLVLLLPAISALALLLGAARLARSRDLGTGMIAARDLAPARLGLLSGPTAQAFRAERGGLAVWVIGVGAFGYILGLVSASVSSAGIPKSLQREVAKLGSGSILTPAGYLAFVFIFFILAVSLFACGQVAAAHREEAEERLETVLAQPVGRRRWLAGRLATAVGGILAISLVAGFFTWAGAASQGVAITLPRMLEAAANCIPTAILFLGLAALAFALLPRAAAAISYALVTVTFLWQLVGSLLGVPAWLVELTPFDHLGLVPVQSFRPGSATLMAGLGVCAAALALQAFRRRDLIGG